jgi:hypothetical protein
MMIMPAKKSSPGRERNPWKIVSIIFIFLFIAILAWGILALRTKPVFAQITEEQITLAEGVVAQDLESRGDSIESYEVSVTNKAIGFFDGHHRPNGMPCMKGGMCQQRKGVQVSLRSNSSTHLYIVDLESKKVLMRSLTEWPTN